MTQHFDIAHYRSGYSFGVGGVVLSGDKVLLAQFAFGANKGEWAIPGGFVERDENLTTAIQREVFEETGVRADVEGLIAVRNRLMREENSIYFIFLLRTETEVTQPDGVEIQAARFFTHEEAQSLPGLRPLSRLVITRVFENKFNLLTEDSLPEFSSADFVLYS